MKWELELELKMTCKELELILELGPEVELEQELVLN